MHKFVQQIYIPMDGGWPPLLPRRRGLRFFVRSEIFTPQTHKIFGGVGEASFVLLRPLHGTRHGEEEDKDLYGCPQQFAISDGDPNRKSVSRLVVDFFSQISEFRNYRPLEKLFSDFLNPIVSIKIFEKFS